MAVEKKDVGAAFVMTCTACKKEERIAKMPPFLVMPREMNFRRIHAKCEQSPPVQPAP